MTELVHLALVGNPNSGKTALFNRLTRSRQKVANYPGVTVERKEGRFSSPSGRLYRILDLPGAYSLQPVSMDEAITRDVCKGHYPKETVPDILVCVIDATNLPLHLRFVFELRQLRRPMIVVLNVMDLAKKRGIRIDRAAFEAALQLPVVEAVSIQRNGEAALVTKLDQLTATLPQVRDYLAQQPVAEVYSPMEQRAEVSRVLAAAVIFPEKEKRIDALMDRWLLHPVFGIILLALILFLIFQAVYGWATPIMDAIKSGGDWLRAALDHQLPSGPLTSLLVNGIIPGISSVLAFLPQILILYAFILVLEESGYLPRAAFLLDRLMQSVGLSGRSLIPLLSSFACAIPGIMATRSIQDPRSRWTTILIAPLMTCSARLPVYALLIGAFVPNRIYFGVINLQGIVLFALYILGIVTALVVATFMKYTADRQNRHTQWLLMELPAYRCPRVMDLVLGVWERGMIFLSRAGGIILALTVLLWFLLSYPGAPVKATFPAIHYSFAGQIGHYLSYIFAPLGFGWEICVALIASLAAREVAVSSLATVYALSAQDDSIVSQTLSPILHQQWSVATGLAMLVWYVYAPMCLSTFAVIKRETGSMKHTMIAVASLFAMAYCGAWITYTLANFVLH